MMDNSSASLGVNDQRNSLFKIHQELCGKGYEMSAGDIRRHYTLNTTANKETSITTVVIYKDARTAKEVENAAKNTKIWESRATPGLEGQTEYFRPPRDIIRRETNQGFVPNDLEEDQQGRTLQGESLPGSPIQITETEQIITIEDDSSSLEITEVI